MIQNLLNLPHDVLAHIFQCISVPGLCALCCTCRGMRDLISEFGWSDYLRDHPQDTFSLAKSRKTWDAPTTVRYDYLTDRAWDAGQFVARPLTAQWRTKLQPVLAINGSRLLVAAANSIHAYGFGSSSPRIYHEASWALSERFSSVTDITSLACTPDPDTYIVGMWDGSIKRIEIRDEQDEGTPSSRQRQPSLRSTTVYQSPNNDIVESLSCEDDLLLSLSATGRATLRSLHDPNDSGSSLDLDARSWTSYLCTTASSPFAAFGTASKAPLVLHRLRQDGSFSEESPLSGPTPSPDSTLDPPPTTPTLDPTRAITLSQHIHSTPDVPSSSACYAIARAPPAAPWGASPELLVAGWYDGRVRMYDLRVASRYHYRGADDSAPFLRPMLAMSDPWLYEPIYSVACGGGAGAHIAAGSARHGVVCLWDMRYAHRRHEEDAIVGAAVPPTARGMSVHAPGNDPSPVFQLALESSRLYGVTDRRAFVLDWGPNATEDTYPPIPARNQGLKRKKGHRGPGFYVTKYVHDRHGSSG
ncbi:hypothetical protein BD626DRAFT_463496 [Schizophyllum amplum]|uniref:F-box domain-containing protein n=1 Tax=Schizophyllum amplum TaxID=97359 RepID=A0A550C1H8_9AGAR|nr:hypothetical protein BD626DRAFT_463496 [Auriculariopsis ampla]